MAKGGLHYHGPNDKVVCAFCTTYIDDNADEEHKRLCTVACPFLMDRESCGNVPIEEHYENMSGSGNSKPTFSADAYGRVDNQLVDETMRDPTERMLTFENWPEDNPKVPQELFEAGFFYSGNDDSVRCFSCGGYVEGWNVSDNPWVEHGKIHPACVFVREKKSQFFIDQLSKDPAVKDRVKELKGRFRNFAERRGFSNHDIDFVLERDFHNPFNDESEVRNAIFSLRKDDFNGRRSQQADATDARANGKYSME